MDNFNYSLNIFFFFFSSQNLVVSADNPNKGVPKTAQILATIAAVSSLTLIACLVLATVYV